MRPRRIPMKPPVVLAIDPSTRHAGLAVGYHRKPFTPVCLLRSMAYDMDLEADYVTRTGELLGKVDELAREFNPVAAVIELPEAYLSPLGTRASTSGSIMKLSFCVGALWSMLWRIMPHVRLAAPREWKGQLPKDVMMRRLKKRGFEIHQKKSSLDESDAICLLDWYVNEHEPHKL